jgi:hypothetical protein
LRTRYPQWEGASGGRTNRRRRRPRPSGWQRSSVFPQIAHPALSPRGTEEQRMTGDASREQKKWSNQKTYRNSQISDYFQNQPKGDRQLGGSWVQVPSPPPKFLRRASGFGRNFCRTIRPHEIPAQISGPLAVSLHPLEPTDVRRQALVSFSGWQLILRHSKEVRRGGRSWKCKVSLSSRSALARFFLPAGSYLVQADGYVNDVE